MSHEERAIAPVLATLYAVPRPPAKGRTAKLDSVKVGDPEAFYMLATYCFDLSRKLEYLTKVARPFAEHLPPELAHEILEDTEAINAPGLLWQERAIVAEKIMLRLLDEDGDEHDRLLKQSAEQVGR
ncbi:MAG: hypothetical protein ACREL3_05590 [Gemmatimonadales bacterium]